MLFRIGTKQYHIRGERKVKIYKFDKVIKEAIDNLKLPDTFKSDHGSCMLAAEILTKKLLSMGRKDFIVVEGYITFPSVEWDEEHTWIEMYDGEKVDPTKNQWGIKNIIYLKEKRKEYTPQEYLSLCENYPEENYSRYLGDYEYIGTCISTVDDSCIWDATEMAQIIENSHPFDIEGIFPFLSDSLKQKAKNNQVEAGINENIVWVYDIVEDIHYFYKKI